MNKGNKENEENKRILSMDLSLNCPAFAVVDIIDGLPRIVKVVHVDNKVHIKWTQAEKLKATATALRDILVRQFLEENRPFDCIVRERGFSRFAQTTQALFRVVGVSDLIVLEDGFTNKVEEIPPSSVKSLIGGYGKATKEEVEEGVRQLLPMDQKDFIFATDDESDAVAVALAYAIKQGWLK